MIRALKDRNIPTFKKERATFAKWLTENRDTFLGFRWDLVHGIWPGGYERTHVGLIRTHTSVLQAQIACALERHRITYGHYPESLDSLVPQFLGDVPKDPIDQEPMRYRKTEDGRFLLYSVGWNAVDENGSPTDEYFHHLKDWVWSHQNLSPPKN